MKHAAARYRLGRSRYDWTVFWQIDEQQTAHEGRCVYYTENGLPDPDCTPQWVTDVLYLQTGCPRVWEPTYCLFGQHLLAELDTAKDKKRPIAIVRQESTAVVYSERYPQFLWLAVGDETILTPQLFLPLFGHPLIVFPERPDGTPVFSHWQHICSEAQDLLHQFVPLSGEQLELLKL